MAKGKNARGRRGGAAALEPPATNAWDDRLARLTAAVQAVNAGTRPSPRTAKLLSLGLPKMAQKLVEEAAEVAIDAVRGERAAVVGESVDLFYNLVVLWYALGIEPAEVWAEMDRREALLGMAEKLPKDGDGTG